MKKLCLNTNSGHFAGFLGKKTGAYTLDGIPIRVGDTVHVEPGNGVNEHEGLVFMSGNNYGVQGSAAHSVSELDVSYTVSSYKDLLNYNKVGDYLGHSMFVLAEFYKPSKKDKPE